MGRITIQNPVLRGFHPDPCICKAKGRYYLITSTFEWLPGVALYESEDLVNWTPRGGILKHLNLEGIPDSAGIWAPALSWDGEFFYLIYTVCTQIDGYFKDVKNYVTTAREIEGPWSDPVFVNASGFDPSMYHEDGRHYVLNPQWDPRPLPGHQKFNGLLLQEFCFEKGMCGEAKVVYNGSGWGTAEGPHLMKKDGFYYILSAEGGTGRHHAVCAARSENIWGPYEPSPYTPLLTAWEKPTTLKKSGHGNLVETDSGEWYLVHLCGRYLERKAVCVLGRETAIQKIRWEKGWPRLCGEDTVPQEEVEAPEGAECLIEKENYRIDWRKGKKTRKELEQRMEAEEWMSLRSPLERKVCLRDEGLWLRGGASLTSLFDQSLIARRLESFYTRVTTTVRFRPYHYAQTAGLVCYYNTKVFHYLYVGYDESKRQRIISVLSNDNFEFREPMEGNYVYLPEEAEEIYLRMETGQERLQFFYSLDRRRFEQAGPALNLSILSDEHATGWAYTGTVVGITAVDGFNKDSGAVFLRYEQEDLEKENV